MTEVVPSDVISAQDAEFFEAVAAGRDPDPSIKDVMPSLRVLQVVQDTYDARAESRKP
jgi:hypothetical protein